MATNNYITVHGRAGLLIPYSRYVNVDNVDVQVDISSFSMYVEIPSARIRKQLVVNPSDSKGLRVVLTRTEVESIPEKESPFIILDETDVVPLLDWSGTIKRVGYKGDPSV